MTGADLEKEREAQKLRDIRDEKIAPEESREILESYDMDDGGRVDILPDCSGENPFVACDTVGRLVRNTESDRFCDADESKDPYDYAMEQGALVAIHVSDCGNSIVLDRDPDQDRTPDAVIYATPQSISNIYGNDGAKKSQIIEAMECEIGEYSKWANGEMVGADIWNKDGNRVDSVSNYYSKEDIQAVWR